MLKGIHWNFKLLGVVVAVLVSLVIVKGEPVLPGEGAQVVDAADLEDLTVCNACVAFTTEICRQVMDYLELMAEREVRRVENNYYEYEEAANSKKIPPKSEPPETDETGRLPGVYSNDLPPVTSIAENARKEACEEFSVRPYQFLPAISLPSISKECKAFETKYLDIVDEFWRTFHRKQVNCARAVDLLCTFHTDVCYRFNTEEVVLNGVATTVYSAPIKKCDKSEKKTVDTRDLSGEL
jgi:hypothetical protein